MKDGLKGIRNQDVKKLKQDILYENWKKETQMKKNLSSLSKQITELKQNINSKHGQP